ncbi:MAG: nucleic acid-binding protein [Propionibacteriaceae bacterium]|jgi:predicted  nucleic acid-binding Zn-ribbon protein|nr:nucleic acid-binding protein [Propionibacteriaceae bacterium]
MKAAPADQARLLEVQSLDTAIAQLKHKAASLPVHRQIEELSKKRRELTDEQVARATALSDAQAAASQAEADVVPVRDRLVRNQQRIDAGAVEAKALTNAIDEVAHLKDRIADLEDIQLEAMDALERAEVAKGEASVAVQRADEQLRQALGERDSEVLALRHQASDLMTSRSDLVQQIPADLMALYDKIGARSGGVGAAKLEGRRCSGCGLEATISDYNHYQGAAVDEVLRCAECERILVR